MPSVVQTTQAVKTPRGRGRPVAVETLHEQAEGLAMGVVAETGRANKHSVKAILFDRIGDNAREELWALLETMEEGFVEGDAETVLAGFQVIRTALRPEIERMDRLEDDEYRYQATGHVAAARRDGRDIIGLMTSHVNQVA
jgi:hypothetical protein